jgi:hypothetical protein
MFCLLTSLVIPTPKHDEVLNETPRIHDAAQWRSGVAARGARAAATGDAGDRLSPSRFA